MKKIALTILAMFLLLSGCNGHLPDKKLTRADAAEKTNIKQINIRHFVKDNDLFVECIIPSVTFSDKKQHSPQAAINVYVDGAMAGEYRTAAFVVKDIKKGVHTVRLEVVKRGSGKDLGLHKQFFITVT
ncbi:hypothetical protein [Heyndrickxia acidiproducens]|uniref:hypothetical protein n=1 Tax=Heyndrickxia acidiproducens TaxID=1121084 RepID=UPI0003684165|nr:hypothetical protein [Heyndrickxia acidiproducens]